MKEVPRHDRSQYPCKIGPMTGRLRGEQVTLEAILSQKGRERKPPDYAEILPGSGKRDIVSAHLREA